MKESLQRKLAGISERHDELARLLSAPEVIADQEQFRRLSVEYSQLEPVVKEFREYQKATLEARHVQEMLSDDDPDVRAMAQEELKAIESRIGELEPALQRLLLPQDPHDRRNVYLEIRAGTGGDEAALFAGDLFRMYSRYAERNDWQVEILSENIGEHGGFKEIIALVSGAGVYSRLKFESGAHRVQRVPETESQGRIHTSAATVAVMPEADPVEEVDIDTADLRVDTYRSSGAGGQHVNKTDSAVRLTHLPSGIVVECQDERSQHKNRARALSLLQAKLLERERQRQVSEQAQTRRDLVGSGDRSERIRTYNFPQGRVTDHRINLTLYKIEEILQGDLDHMIRPLIHEYQTDQLASLAEE